MSWARLARWRLAAEIWVWHHGFLWPMVIGFAVLNVAVWTFIVMPQQKAHDELVTRLGLLHQKQSISVPAVGGGEPQVQAWQRARQNWPEAATMEKTIAGVLESAGQKGLQVDQGDFQYRVEEDLSAIRLTMNVPMRGSYLAVRKFVVSVLRAHPNMALEELLIKRESAASADTEVKLRFVAWYQLDPAEKSR